MSFAVFVAGCIHALLLFGVGFAMPVFEKPPVPTMDVVLATQFSAKAPERADFLGQANQLGGGNSQRTLAPRSASQSDMPAPDTEATAERASGAEQAQREQNRILLAKRSDRQIAASTAQAEVQPFPQTIDTASLIERSLAIASLSAELSQEQALQARAPRSKLIAAAIVSSTEAPYFDRWRRQVERIGNQYFPTNLPLARELIVRADINADGTVREVVILQSSGDLKLDQRAREIVHRAQPFPPFTAAMRQHYDVLQIIRLWRFEPGDGFHTEAQ